MPNGPSQRNSYCNKKVKQYHKYYGIIHDRDDEAPIRHFFPKCKPKQTTSLLLRSNFPIIRKLDLLKIFPLKGSSCNTWACFLLFKQYKRKSPQKRKKRERSRERQDYYRISQPALKRVISFSAASLPKGWIQQNPSLLSNQSSSDTCNFLVLPKETPHFSPLKRLTLMVPAASQGVSKAALPDPIPMRSTKPGGS